MQAAVLMPHVGAAHTELGNLGLGHGSVGASTGKEKEPCSSTEPGESQHQPVEGGGHELA